MSQVKTLDCREETELAVTRFFHMANSHCPGNLAPLFTPDVEWSGAEPIQGQEAVNAHFLRLWERYPELTYHVEDVLVDGERAAAEVTCEHGPGECRAHCVLFHFRGGRIRRIRVY